MRQDELVALTVFSDVYALAVNVCGRLDRGVLLFLVPGRVVRPANSGPRTV